MKKHPIDELFEKKLTDYEQKPSNEAWAKIQGRTKKKRKVLAGWIWYAAAVLSLIFVTGYIVWQMENGKEKMENPVAAEVKVSPKTGVREALPQEAVVKKTVSPTIAKSQKAGINTNQEALAGNAVEVKSIEGKDNQVQSFPNEVDNAKAEIAKIDTPEVIIPSVNSNPEASGLQRRTSITPTPVDVRKPENRVVLVTVEEPISESGADDKAKTSKFSRVLRQLKNAREGERVDWNEMGVNPKSIFARADNQGETKNSDNTKSKK